MIKNQLLELYEKLRLENINLTSINYLKDISDDELKLIKLSKYKKIVVRVLSNSNFKIVNSELKIKLINIINSAKNEIIADYTALVIENINVLISGLSLELAQIISQTDEEYQASNTLEVAINSNVLSSSNSVNELVQIVSITKGINKSNYITYIATNINILNTNQAVELIKIINKSSSDYKVELVYNLIKHKIPSELPPSKVIEYIKSILDTKSDKDAEIQYNKLLKEIEILEQYKQTDEQIYFWDLYQKCPNAAIQLLKDEKDIEIFPYTKIRKKRTDS